MINNFFLARPLFFRSQISWLALAQGGLILAFLLIFSSSASWAYVASKFLGGWPGICEDDICHDDGAPLSFTPPEAKRRLLQHQLTSPTCPTDLVFVSLEYYSDTGSPILDKNWFNQAQGRFENYKKRAMDLVCNDFEGCSGLCLPVGFEVKVYLQQSSPSYLSVFQVERFFGNFRRERHVRGTVKYSFLNYSLISGAPLTLQDLFPKPLEAVDKIWKKVDSILEQSGNCLSKNMLLTSGRQVTPKNLTINDFLLSQNGATLALYSRGANRRCQSQAIDLTVNELVEIGANRSLWGP
ncbi:MAG: hypothetical protein LBV23_04640 [Deltaproteobacteria bacterium]|jgi:hypothetical protein|nr:hypothetical protein [Deltaproteobacteria bacterium]